MGLFTLFTDPHIGTKRAAHTTRESSKRLQTSLYTAALEATGESGNSICLGDLFDRSTNQEDIIVQGFNVAERCRGVLSGNHDCSNREGVVTSLDALKEMGCPIVSAPDISAPYFTCDNGIYMVPHHASQETFEKAMWEASAHAADHRDGLGAYLLLHCNWDCAFDIEDDTLNLPASLAEELLEHFDLILLGHEHRPAKYMDGRVVILGNLHATSFADISDKFVYELDTETAELTQRKVWSMDERYRKLKFGETIPDLAGVQFVDVTGAEADGVAVSQYLQEVWAAGSDLLAVRNSVTLADVLSGVEAEEPAEHIDVAQRIDNDLVGSDLQALYRELRKEAEL